MTEKVLTLENTIESQFKAWVEDHFIEAGALKSLKLQAIDVFKNLGLPSHKSEAYKYTAISKALEKNIDFSSSTEGKNWSKEACQKKFYDIKDANHLVFINGLFISDYSIVKSASSDLEIRVLDGQAFNEKEEIKDYLGQIGDNNQDAFAALNLAYFNQGLFIKSSKNSDNLPVYIYQFVDAESSGTVVYPRILVVGETGSRLKMYEKSFVTGTNNVFSNAIFEAEVKQNAEVRYTKIQNFDTNIFTVDGIYGHQEKDSRFYTNTYSFKGALIRNNIYISVDAENCEAHMNGLYLISGKSHVDNNTSVDHRKANSFSNELYKGIIDEKARAVFNGKIYVRPDAQKTNAFQANNNIILSDTAIVNSKPQLEIWADDVKCSHGCTTGQLDEEAIFYLRSRGIEKNIAKALMLNAFATETLQEVKSDLVVEEVEQLILNKLN